MLVTIQFPIIDTRRFSDQTNYVLKNPEWKFISESDIDSGFIRSVGGIKKRMAGGNAAGENYISTAKQAIKFETLPELSFQAEFNEKVTIKVRPYFRRFYFDGQVAGKYEIGFSIRRNEFKVIQHEEFFNLLKSILNCTVNVKIPFHRTVKTRLGECGKHLLEQYKHATIYSKFQNKDVGHVYSGTPCIYVETSVKERLHLNYKSLKLESPNLTGGSLSCFQFSESKFKPKVWLMKISSDTFVKEARQIRISILNLNMYREALYKTLKSVAKGELSPKPRSKESERLNQFFKSCFGKYLKKLPKSIERTDYESIVLSFEDQLLKGERKKIRENLKNEIKIRKNYLRSVESYLEKNESSHPTKKPLLILFFEKHWKYILASVLIPVLAIIVPLIVNKKSTEKPFNSISYELMFKKDSLVRQVQTVEAQEDYVQPNGVFVKYDIPKGWNYVTQTCRVMFSPEDTATVKVFKGKCELKGTTLVGEGTFTFQPSKKTKLLLTAQIEKKELVETRFNAKFDKSNGTFENRGIYRVEYRFNVIKGFELKIPQKKGKPIIITKEGRFGQFEVKFRKDLGDSLEVTVY